MNEKAEQLVTEAADKVLRWAEATEEFTIEQAPLLAQEIVRYGAIKHGTFWAVGVLIALLGLSGIRFAIKSSASDDKIKDGDLNVFIVGWVLFVAGCCFSITHGLGFVQALVAPRLYILEQIGNLL